MTSLRLGGHLWVAALVCCVLYLASALVLRDHLFVYVLNGGIAMTGLLMLTSSGRFWEIAAPATLLVVLGLISIHVERAFAGDRRSLLPPTFRAGLLPVGTSPVGGRVALGVGGPTGRRLALSAALPAPVRALAAWPAGDRGRTWGQYLALALVLAGSYAYFYSDIVVRRLGLYVYLGVFTLLWAEMLVIELVADKVPTEAAIIALALTGLAANLLQPKLPRWQSRCAPAPSRTDWPPRPCRSCAGQPLGLFLSTVPVLLGPGAAPAGHVQPLNELWRLPTAPTTPSRGPTSRRCSSPPSTCRVGAHLIATRFPGCRRPISSARRPPP